MALQIILSRCSPTILRYFEREATTLYLEKYPRAPNVTLNEHLLKYRYTFTVLLLVIELNTGHTTK